MGKSSAEPKVGFSKPEKCGPITTPSNPTGRKGVKGYSKSTGKFK